MAGVHAFYHLSVLVSKLPSQPCTEQTVNEHIRVSQVTANPIGDITVSRIQAFDGLAHPLQNVQVDFGIAFDFSRIAANDYGHLNSAVNEVSGDDIAVAAVVAGAAEYTYFRLGTILQLLLDQFGTTASGVFHQDHAWYTEHVDGPCIKSTNLLSCHNHRLFIG